MAIIFIKVISLFIKGVAKPVINWVSYHKRRQLIDSNNGNSKYSIIRRNLILLGQATNYYATIFNRLIFNLSKTNPVKKLTEEKSIEKGVEIISEIFIYTIIFSIPISEGYRKYRKDKIKEECKEKNIKRMKAEMDSIEKKNIIMKKELEELVRIWESKSGVKELI